MKKHAIIGAGAVGSILYHLLSSNQELEIDVFAKEERTITIEYKGQLIEQSKETKVFPSTEKYDCIYICVKATALSNLLLSIKSMCHADTIIILCQNGISQSELIHHPHTYHAVVYISGQKNGDRVIFFQDNTLILPDESRLQPLKLITDQSQLNIVLDPNHAKKQWIKLLVNLGINSITALTKNTAQVLEVQEIYTLIEQLLEEGVTIASHHGIDLPEDIIATIMSIYSAYDASMGTSMYYDVINGQTTEYEYIQGYLNELSTKYQLYTPLLNIITLLLKGYQYKK